MENAQDSHSGPSVPLSHVERIQGGGSRRNRPECRQLVSHDLAVDTDIIKLTGRSPLALVNTWSATEHVGPGATQQHIVATEPVATAWQDRPRIPLEVLELASAVVARPTIDKVITVPPSEAITALPTTDFVVARTTEQGVVSLASEELDSDHFPRSVRWWIADDYVPMLRTVNTPALDGETVLVPVRGKPSVPICPTARVPVGPTLIAWRPRRARGRCRGRSSAVVEPVGIAPQRSHLLLRG